jgi:hypothetical protein
VDDEIEPPPPCKICGNVALWWWDIDEGLHCSVCEATNKARSRKLAERAERLRNTPSKESRT